MHTFSILDISRPLIWFKYIDWILIHKFALIVSYAKMGVCIIIELIKLEINRFHVSE